MSYYLDLGKRAVVLLAAMVGALGNGAADGLVGGVAVAASAAVLVLVHFSFSFRDIVFFAGVSFCPIIVSDFFRVIHFYFLFVEGNGGVPVRLISNNFRTFTIPPSCIRNPPPFAQGRLSYNRLEFVPSKNKCFRDNCGVFYPPNAELNEPPSPREGDHEVVEGVFLLTSTIHQNLKI